MSTPLLLGIEIGGTKLQLGLGHGDGRLLALERSTVAPGSGAGGIRSQIQASVAALVGRVDPGLGPIQGIGIGFGGPVESSRGTVIKSHHVEGWDEFPLADWARRQLGCPNVALQNDADTAGLGEARFGAGVGYSPILYVTIGSGIGGGLIDAGRIYRGSGFGAVEIGHLRIEGPDLPAEGEILEGVASGWSIAREGRRRVQGRIDRGQSTAMTRLCTGQPSLLTAVMVAEAARLGDEDANAILDRATSAMARGLAHAVTLLAPRRIVLGGGVSLIGDEHWFGPIRRKLAPLVFPPFRGTYEVVPASLGEEVVVHGALALALDGALKTNLTIQ